MTLHLFNNKYIIEIPLLISAICMFICFQPYFVWGTTYHVIAQVIISGILLLHIEKKPGDLSPNLLIFLLYIFIILRSSYSDFGNISILTFIPLVFAQKDFLYKLFKYFVVVFALSMGVSLVMYILVKIMGMNMPNIIIDPLNDIKENAYYHAYFMLVTIVSHGIDSTRFFGPFDEPGVVGTIAAALLTAQRLDLKKWYNILILVAGIFSFSMFFYIIILSYLVLFASRRGKILSAIALILAFSLPVITNNESFNLYVIDRVTSGNIDNRTIDSYDAWFQEFMHSSGFIWGLGGDVHIKYNEGGASYKDIITDFGIVFFVLYCLSFIWRAFKMIKDKKRILLYAVIVAAILYQRPFITIFGYFFLLYIPCVALSEKYDSHELQQLSK